MKQDANLVLSQVGRRKGNMRMRCLDKPETGVRYHNYDYCAQYTMCRIGTSNENGDKGSA